MELCDANATGSEKASVFIYTKTGRFTLCMHHFQIHREAIRDAGYKSMLAHPQLIPGFTIDPALEEMDELNTLSEMMERPGVV